jgi:hypothetical protein
MSKQVSAAKTVGKTLTDFRAEHDKDFIVPKRITEGLAKLGEGWVYEQEFLKLCSLSTSDFARYREQFTDFYVTTSGRNPRRAWAGTKELARKMREMSA